jgi:hypothetical protein
MMRYSAVSLFLLLVFSGLCSVVSAQEKTPITVEKREAEKAWEALIRTKGGREKLHSVTNMLTELSNLTRLDIFPNSYWDFGYYPVVNTPGVRLWDGTKSQAVYAGPDGVTSTGNEPIKHWIAFHRIPFILETKYDKPEPIRITRIKQGGKTFEVLETLFDGERLDFIYEDEEMLVSEVKFYDKKLGWWKGYSFSNYTEINGIIMPQTWGVKNGLDMEKAKYHNMRVTFSFNVAYDPELFTRPLKATTADAWKQKQKN